MDFYCLFVLPWVQRLITGYTPPALPTVDPFHFGVPDNSMSPGFDALKRSIEESEVEEMASK